MSDWKRRIIRLAENYMNDFRGDAVQEIYGKGSKIVIKNMWYANSIKSIMIEVVVVLGDVINEHIIDRSLVDILIQDSMVYFYPEHKVKTIVRFDV